MKFIEKLSLLSGWKIGKTSRTGEVIKVIIMVVFHHQLYWGHFVSSLLFQQLIIKRTELENIVFTFV